MILESERSVFRFAKVIIIRKVEEQTSKEMSCQCEGKTKSGLRCKNRTKSESKRCHLHLHSELATAEVLSVKPTPVTVPVVSVPNGKEEVKDLVEQSSTKLKKSDCCCVCMEEMPSSDNLDCGHPVCRGCVAQLRNTTCPICRREIKAKHIDSKVKQKMKSRFEEDRLSRINMATQQFLQETQPHLAQFLQPTPTHLGVIISDYHYHYQ
jgi:hypothetical protein